MHHLEAIIVVAKSIIFFAAGSIVGLIAQIDAGLWEKSAWLIMCSLFLAGLTTLWRTNQRIINEQRSADAAELARLREENVRLRRQLHEESHE